MFKFNYSKYNPEGLVFGGLFLGAYFWGLIFGGLFLWGLLLVHGSCFPFQKLVPKHNRAYTRWGLLSEFYGILIQHVKKILP